jgi:hypothetical protein
MKALLGSILLAVGILIAGASGLCTVVFFVTAGAHGGLGVFPLMLVVGGIPFAIGLGLFFAGRALVRSGRED